MRDQVRIPRISILNKKILETAHKLKAAKELKNYTSYRTKREFEEMTASVSQRDRRLAKVRDDSKFCYQLNK